MNKSALVLAVYFLALLFVFANYGFAEGNIDKDLSELVGIQYGPKEFPKGYKYLGGMLVQKDDGNDTGYGLTFVQNKKTKTVWLEYMTHRDAVGNPYWKIVYVLKLPQEKKNEEYNWNPCNINGKPDNSVFALIDNKTYKVKRAWRANIIQEKIDEIPIKGIVCFYPEPD